MLERLTSETFRDRVGQTFHLDGGDGSRREIVLAEVTEHRLGGQARPDGRVPFSLEFFAADGPVLPQRIYDLQHPDLGSLGLFLVPIGPDPERGGIRYEAVFT